MGVCMVMCIRLAYFTAIATYNTQWWGKYRKNTSLLGIYNYYKDDIVITCFDRVIP